MKRKNRFVMNKTRRTSNKMKKTFGTVIGVIIIGLSYGVIFIVGLENTNKLHEGTSSREIQRRNLEYHESMVCKMGNTIKMEVAPKEAEGLGSKLIHLDDELTAQENSVVEPKTITEPEEVSVTRANALQKSGQERDLPIQTVDKKEESQNSFSDDEILLFQKTVFAEVGVLSEKAQKGVASVILNRIKMSEYPDDLHDVIFEKNQFSTAVDGQICFWYWPDNTTSYLKEVEEGDITDEVRNSVEAAINGDNPIGDFTGFYAPKWMSAEMLYLYETEGLYSPNWPRDENGNVIDGEYYNPVKIDGETVYRRVIVIDGTVFHGKW